MAASSMLFCGGWAVRVAYGSTVLAPPGMPLQGNCGGTPLGQSHTPPQNCSTPLALTAHMNAARHRPRSFADEQPPSARHCAATAASKGDADAGGGQPGTLTQVGDLFVASGSALSGSLRPGATALSIAALLAAATGCEVRPALAPDGVAAAAPRVMFPGSLPLPAIPASVTTGAAAVAPGCSNARRQAKVGVQAALAANSMAAAISRMCICGALLAAAAATRV